MSLNILKDIYKELKLNNSEHTPSSMYIKGEMIIRVGEENMLW